MKRLYKERMWIALACVAGFVVVLVVERMNRGVTQTVASSPASADLKLARVTGPATDVVWINAPWEWSAQPRKKSEWQQVRLVRSAPVPLRPRQFDLIDFRHQPSVTVEMGR